MHIFHRSINRSSDTWIAKIFKVTTSSGSAVVMIRSLAQFANIRNRMCRFKDFVATWIASVPSFVLIEDDAVYLTAVQNLVNRLDEIFFAVKYSDIEIHLNYVTAPIDVGPRIP